MDDLFLLIFLFIILPLLSRLFGGKRPQKRQPGPQRRAPRELEAEDDVSLEEALRQIREAMMGPDEEFEPEPESVPSADAGSFHDRMAPRPAEERPRAPQPEIRREKTAFEKLQEAAEKRARVEAPPVSAEALKASPIYAQQGPRSQKRHGKWEKRGNMSMRNRLHNPHTALDALIMTEIMSLPRSMRRWKAGRS